MLLDQALPTWEFQDRHALPIPAPATDIMTAIHAVTWRESPTFRRLVLDHFGGRRIQPDRAILETFFDTPFQLLAESNDELVIGCILTRCKGVHIPEQLSLEEFRAFSTPGCWKEVANFHFAHGLLTTESRVQTLDPVTHRLFSIYWLLIRLPSGWVRRAWLQAIKKRAMQAADVTGSRVTRSQRTT